MPLSRVLIGLLALPLLFAQDPNWNRPFPAFRIAGNLHYVGASDLTAYLVTTPEGHILLDSGMAETVPIIRDGVRKLGFRLEDVKILLNSHAHYDHAAGLAELKRLTGAKLMVSAESAALLELGGKNDFAFGDRFGFAPVKADRILKDGDTVTLGGVTMTARLTPGHTKGNTTWTMKVQDGPATYDVVFAGSMSAPGYQLVGNTKYPRILEDYAASQKLLKGLPCDLFLSAHGGFFDSAGKYARLQKGASPNPFLEPGALKRYVEHWEAELAKQLAAEKARKQRP